MSFYIAFICGNLFLLIYYIIHFFAFKAVYPFSLLIKDEMKDFIQIKTDISNIYLGSEEKKSDIFNSKMIVTKIKKDSKGYKLI